MFYNFYAHMRLENTKLTFFVLFNNNADTCLCLHKCPCMANEAQGNPTANVFMLVVCANAHTTSINTLAVLHVTCDCEGQGTALLFRWRLESTNGPADVCERRLERALKLALKRKTPECMRICA